MVFRVVHQQIERFLRMRLNEFHRLVGARPPIDRQQRVHGAGHCDQWADGRSIRMFGPWGLMK